MASYLPPTEQLPIFDNEVFSSQNDPNAPLTIAIANLLYLRKTFPDTATALETFQAGIQTDNINAIGNYILNIGNATTNVYLNAVQQLILTTSDPFLGGTISVVSDYVTIGDYSITQNLTMATNTLLSLASLTISTDSTTLDLNNTNPIPNTINIGSLVNSSTTIRGSSMGLQSTTMGVNINTISTTATTSITEIAPLIDVYVDTLSLNSNYSTTNNINIGNVSTTDILQQNANTLNLNYTKATPNAINIGTSNTTTIDVNTAVLKLNSVNTNANTVAIGNATGTTTITVNKPITIGYTILPTAGQIGFVLNIAAPAIQNWPVGTAVSQTALCSTLVSPVLPIGTWMVALTAGVWVGATSGTITQCNIAVLYNVVTNIPAKQTNIMSYTPPINALTNIMNCAGIIESDGLSATAFDHSLTYIGVGAAFSTRPSNSWSWKFIRVG